MRNFVIFLLASLLSSGVAQGQQSAPFDLVGPSIQIGVKHGNMTLPISEVPNLSEGDRLSIKAALPDDQSANYLLVAAFLRGATNPPPKKWISEAKTWKRKKNSLDIVVPKGARQLVVFLAPETGGDFDALLDAVRGRPGAFVRASQDLNQASLDRSRLDAFLSGIRDIDPAHSNRMEEVSPVLARSLAIKFNAECLQRMPELQGACLTEDRDALVLNDGHSTSITEALTGAPTDLAMQLSATPQGGLGYYSPYIGVVRDLARIFGAFSTADYQYIPALSIIRDDSVGLLLNAVPSFQKPQSAIVVALPSIEEPRIPPLQPGTQSGPLCAAQPGLVLPVEGAPLIYSTRYAHDMVLRLTATNGRKVELPLVAKADRGGFVIAGSGINYADFGPRIDAEIRGYWGFEEFTGPRFQLQNPEADWQISGSHSTIFDIGRDHMIALKGAAPACIESMTLLHPSGSTKPVEWKVVNDTLISTTLPLADARAGPLTLQIRQFGMKEPVNVKLEANDPAARIDPPPTVRTIATRVIRPFA